MGGDPGASPPSGPGATLSLPTMAIDFDQFDVLTFDCYGTLIDWEAGLLAGLRAILDPRA